MPIHKLKNIETVNNFISGELKTYMANVFLPAKGIFEKLPLADEEFVETWRGYFAESQKSGIFQTLKQKLPQLNFPIEKNISMSEEYRRAVKAEVPPESLSNNSGVAINAPDELQFIIHKTPVGSIPIIIVKNREDFVNLYRAFAFKNEPAEIKDSTGGLALSGYNNCGRYIAYKKKQASEDPFGIGITLNPAEQKRHYQDSFLLLSDGPYSGISSGEAGFSDAEWRAHSLKIRIGHESAHYFTKRCLGSMRNNAHDELIADYAGLCNAFGKYDSGLFLKFCGIENYPEINPAGRINNYKGTPPLTDADFKTMCGILYNAAINVEDFDGRNRENFSKGDFTIAAILCMASLAIDEIASVNGVAELEKALELI